MKKNTSTLLSLSVIALLVLVPIMQALPIPSIPSAYADSLVPVTTSVTRSFSYPLLNFMGHSDSNLTTSLTWYANGTTHISDSRGNGFNFAVPILSGVTFTLLQNSTVVDQKVVGLTSSYDIYWNAVTNKNGIVQKYQLTITGSSVNGTTLQYPITSKENIVSDRNEFWATGASTSDYQSNDAIFRTLGGLGINWSDSIKQGYQVSFDQSSSTLDVTVGKSFLVDPTIITTGVPSSSPASADYFEGERRVVNIGGNLFAFY